MKKKMSVILVLALVLFPVSMSAYATPTPGNVPVEGTIQNTDASGGPRVGPDDTYEIQIPTGVKFYVTQNTFPNVYNVDASADILNPNSIINNNPGGIAYKVCLKSFAHNLANNAAASTLASTLTLNLTGSLVDGTIVTGTTNFALGTFTNTTYYPALLLNSAPWSFGFGGAVPNTYPLTSAGLFPQYTMNMEFDFA